ncbi:MAG: M3 family oligoendopeptidase [Acidobacteriota bacterium]
MLTHVSREFERKFVPLKLDFASWKNIQPLFESLEARTLNSVGDLENWILDRSELMDVLGEEGALRYIRMTCDTENKELEAAYFHFLEEISENMKAADDRLRRKLLGHPMLRDLPLERYEVLIRRFRNELELFRDENVPLETEESKFSQQYQKLAGSLTVQFEGREQTLQQMSRYLELPDRNLRHRAWQAVVERRLAERDTFEGIFDDLLGLRIRIARNAGFKNYRDYAFKSRERFDYTVEDCLRFHDAVEETIVPLARKLDERRASAMNVHPLRPWDMSVDPLNRPPLRPFERVDQLVARCREIVQRISPRFGAFADSMNRHNLLDLESRKAKAPGGYQSSLTESRLPFIFMNAVGLDGDVRTLLHEFGHAFHVFATRHLSIGEYRHAPLEFCEVASMSMELLGGEFLSIFYADPAEERRSRKRHLEGVIDILPWIAQVDAFQHWIYTHAEHSVQQREDAWQNLYQRFGGLEDWTGLEQARRSSWHRQLHIFELPFYYIEYAIAQLGALQVWIRAKTDLVGAVEEYWNALQLGGSRPLPELFRKAGIRFDFRPEVLKPLMDAVGEELDKLADYD